MAEYGKNGRPAGAGGILPPMSNPGAPFPVPDLREKSSFKGKEQVSERRLWMQLLAFTGARDLQALVDALRSAHLEAVLYLDVNDPRGVAALVMAEDPAVLTGAWRDLMSTGPFGYLVARPELTMTGRTYATGREPDLEFALLQKPRQTALNPAWPWAVWYPLRRKPAFAVLPPEEQGKILHEHAMIGMAYGGADYAHDVRLSCYGLDRDDNEFVIGLLGKDLAPLSQCVQEMRKTVQTSKYIKKLGPFFVGRAVWQAPAPGR